MRRRSISRISAGNAGEARRGPVGPQRDGGRMTDGQLDGRTQRCEELSGKDKTLSNGVQSDAIDAGPRRVARKRGVAAA
jgi:hypothetical protein